MKLEIRAGARAHQVELEQSDEGDFKVRLTGTGEETRELVVQLLSRTRNRWTLRIEGRVHDVLISANGDLTLVDWGNQTWEAEVYDRRRRLQRQASGSGEDGIAVLKAQMPGKVIEVFKQEGDPVELGEGLAIVEAMKMQNELKSPKRGTVVKCRLTPGDTVNAGEVLYVIH